MEKTAAYYAIKAHAGQIRKYTGEPYVTHCAEVVRLVSLTSSGQLSNVLAAAWLHDTIEDCGVTGADLLSFFPLEVVAMVIALTNKEIGNRKERKTKELVRLANASSEVQTIKLADLISNWPSIRDHDPRFAIVYRSEATDLCEALTKGNELLRRLLQFELNTEGKQLK